ncbi:non-ribosomal peptide synthetase [Streptomyces sp. NPDC048196]|uniref:non-ribosomal peptide synthetase n=1 Tax=Streptomyces sp. NPDC048196 TaxID=3154712 RepID=UPI0033E6BA8F
MDQNSTVTPRSAVPPDMGTPNADTRHTGTSDWALSPPALTGPRVSESFPYGIQGLVREQAQRTPDRVACADGDRAWTYREIELASDALATVLLEVTGGGGAAVAVRLAKSVEVTVAFLGVLKAGCWYVPIALDDPDERVALMLADTQAAAVVTGTPDEPGTPFLGMPALAVPAPPHRSADIRPLTPVPPGQPAYVLFTSGSTGAPKGVIVGSDALCNRLTWMRRAYPLRSRDVVLQKTPCTFDVSGWEIFLPLITGARCQYLAEGGQRDPRELAAAIRRRQVTVCHFVPSMLAEFLADPALAPACSSLRLVFCSGEALPSELVAQFQQAMDADLVNLYGPTEATIDVTHWPVPNPLPPHQPVLIGQPIDNTNLYVLDDQGRPVAAGDQGELWVGGTPVALGYADRPDATAAAFSELDGEPRYRTGDLVRVVGDELEYLGRIDDQLKVRGVRIEPAEIENALCRHPGVGQTIVVPQNLPNGDLELAAVATPAHPPGEARPALTELRTFLAHRLPRAYLPATVLWVDTIPLTRSGKADRIRLRDLVQGTSPGTPDADPAAPDTAPAPGHRTGPQESRPDEETLTGTWWSLLGRLPADGAETGFVTLGGHSLTAVRLLAWCRNRYGVDVPLRMLLDHDASLAELTAVLDAAGATQKTSAEPIKETPA